MVWKMVPFSAAAAVPPAAAAAAAAVPPAAAAAAAAAVPHAGEAMCPEAGCSYDGTGTTLARHHKVCHDNDYSYYTHRLST